VCHIGVRAPCSARRYPREILTKTGVRWRGAYSTVDQFSAHLSEYWNLETCALKFDARVDPDCSGVFYRKKNLRACRFTMYFFFNLAGAPKRTVGYLRCRTIPHCEMLRIRSPGRDEANLSTSQQLESAKWSKLCCSFGLWYNLRLSPNKILDTSAAGPASWNPAIWVLKLP